MKSSREVPLHHIDTSVILEPINTENGRYCRRYLQKLNYNYRGKISFPALSEIQATILSVDDYNIRQDSIETIYHLIKSRKIKFYAPKFTAHIIMEIRNIDKRIEPLDREILACSIEDKALVLVTLDSTMINNKHIENAFKIKIKHPKELV